ncbi:uncharacterized protein [Haliotis cracherodii]|uniref:uncharacterized protein n=1 Tax=Haliotis cracherodii TaxID=6455 RepID=UPI0039EA4512
MLSLLVLALTLGVATPKLHESRYTGKREYVYRYMAQTVTGIPGASKVYSGVKVMANVRLQFHTASVIIAQLEDLNLFTMNDAFRDVNPTREQVLPSKMSRFFCPVIYKTLMEPFTFTYTKGHVTDLKTPENEAYWSVNIKRGIVSLLEVNMEKRWTPVAESEEAPVYAAYEMSASGVCRTVYTVEDPEFNTEVPEGTMVVTKTRDFKNCHVRPAWFKTMFSVRMCAECEAEKTLALTEGAQVRYTLKGNRKNFVILSAVGESYVSFYPYSAERGHFSTIINQTMYLTEATDLADSTEIARIATMSMAPRSLITFVPETIIDNQFPFAATTQKPKTMDEMMFSTKKYIVNVLKTAAQSMTGPAVLAEGALFPVIAVTMMRRANETILTDIWDTYAIPKAEETDDEMAMRKVVWTCMAATGNYLSAKLIMETCVAKKIPAPNCATLINVVALTNTPNNTLIEKLLTVATDMGEGEEPQFVRSIWLSIGAIANKLAYAERYELTTLTETIPVITRILAHEKDPIAREELTAVKEHLLNRQQDVTKLYSDTRSRIVGLIRSQLTKAGVEPKVMALKTAGNAGLPELIPLCTTIITDTDQPQVVRFMAVFAMLKMAEFAPRMVIEPLIPVFMKTTDSAAVRIAVFTVIMKARPTRTIIEMFARHIAREPDLQVSSYMYTFLETTANTTHPCFQTLAMEAARAIHMAPRVTPGLQYSAFRTLEMYTISPAIRAGVGAQVGIIGSNSSIVPKAISTVLNTHIFGLSANILEVGVFTEGFEAALEKLFGPEGVITNRKSILDVFAPRARRSTDATANIEELSDRLNVKPRRLPTPSGSLYVKMFGHEIRYFSLDEALAKLASAGKVSLSYKETEAGVEVPVDVHESLFLGDADILLPTEAGMPVSARLAATAAIKVKGNVIAKVTPALFESRRQSAPVEAKAIFKVRPSAVMELNGYLAVHAFMTGVGAGFRIRTKVNAPMEGRVTAHLASRKITAAIVPPIQEEPLVELDCFPLTFQTINTVDQEKIIEVAEGARIVEDLVEYGNNTMGLNIIARVKRASPYGSTLVPSVPLAGRASVQVFMKPGPSPPEAVIFQAQVAAGTPIKPSGGSDIAAVSSCDCTIGRLTLCYVSCAEEDVTDPKVIEAAASLEDFPDLATKDISISELKAKLQAKLGDSVRLSPVGHKLGLIATIDASSPTIPRKVQLETLWQSINSGHMHQFVMRVARTALPAYPMPWEMITQVMMQYPNRLIEPKMLLDPSYHTQIQHDLQFMTRFMSHRPVLAQLNQTVVTMLNRRIQHLTGAPKPEAILRKLAFQLFARANDTEVRALLPEWRNIVVLMEWAGDVWERAVDPIFILKHVDTIVAKLAETEKIQLSIIQKLQAIAQDPPASSLVVPMLEYCLTEHYAILVKITSICSRAAKMAIVPEAETLYSKGLQLITNLDEQMIQHAAILSKIPPPPETMEVTLAKLWPKLERISEAQFSVLKTIKTTGQVTTFPSLQPVVDVVGMAKETIPVLETVLKTSETIDLNIVPVLTKLAVQHTIVYHALDILVQNAEVIPSPTNESQFSHVMRALKAQVSALTITSAVLVKFQYEIYALTPVLAEGDLTAVKTLQMVQMALGFEMNRVSGMRMYTPFSSSLEVPEQVFSIADGVIDFAEEVATKVEIIAEQLISTNIEPTISIFEKATFAIYQLKSVVRELKVYVKTNLFFSSEIARSIDIIRKCDAVLLTVESLEIKTTTAFEKIWSTASQPEVTGAMPMSAAMMEMAISVTSQKQGEIKIEIDRLAAATKQAAMTSIQPKMETILNTCRGIQGKIDWIQLWGLPLGHLSPMFAHVITVQQEVLKRLKELVTSAATELDNAVAINFALEDLQGELARVVMIGSVEMSDVKPIPALKTGGGIPSMPINPITNMASNYLPLAITGYCNITFGNIGRTPRTIIMKLYASKSIEQMMFESQQLCPLVRDEGVEVAIAREEADVIQDVPEHPIYHLLNSLHHRHIIAEYNPEDVTEWADMTLHKLTHFFTAYHYWNSATQPAVERKPGLIHVMNEARINNPAGDWFIMTPNATTALYGIYTPVTDILTIPVAMTRPATQRRLMLAPYLGPYLPTTCKAFFKTVRTFDGVEYTLPNIGTCPAVLAMDCSPAKTFAITMSTTTADYSLKVLEIIAEGRKIRMAATTTGATLSVNGDPITVTRTAPYVLERTVSYGEPAVAAKITLEHFYNIELPLLGIQITTDGNFISVKASPMFKLKTCGLCSNMDGQQRHEFEAPDGAVFNSPEPFISSYVIKGANCPRPTMPQIITRMESACAPVEAPIVKYRKTEGEICYSTTLVKRCPRSCRVGQRSPADIGFHCVPKRSREAKAIRQLINRREYAKVAALPVSARYQVIQQVTCISRG